MHVDVLLFELRRRLRQPSTYVYFSIFAFFGFMGIWRASVGHGLLAGLTQAGRGNIEADAPYALYHFIAILSTFGVLIVATWFGDAAGRDYRDGMYHLIFSYPIGKLRYLGGRFAGALVPVFIVFSGLGLGGLIAAYSPLVAPEGIGEVRGMAFVEPYLVVVLPNLLFTGALFFSLALLGRRFLPVWAGLAGFVVLIVVALGLEKTGGKWLAALLDPSGMIAGRLIYGNWSIAQKNEWLVPLAGPVLANRILWTAVAAAIGVFTWRRFRFAIPEISGSGEVGLSRPAAPVLGFQPSGIEALPATVRRFSFSDHLRRALYVMTDDFTYVTRRRSFYVVLALGLSLVLVTGFRNIGVVRGTQTFPVTTQVLEALCDNLYFLGLIITLFSASAVVWRERSWHSSEIFDALPVPRWVPVLGKVGATALVHAVVMALLMIGGMTIQAARGYFHFEPALYLTELFGVRLVYYILISVLALFFLVLTGRRLAGFILTLFFIDDFMAIIGLEHHLWTFASRPPHRLSDMNGYSPFGAAIVAYDLYWIFASVVLIVLAVLLYPRGLDTGFKQRVRAAKRRLSAGSPIAAGVGVMGCLTVGSIIVYNTTILNRFETGKDIARRKADYEKTYKRWDEEPQPHVTGITASVDIYPRERRVEAKGKVRLVNETRSVVDTLFVQVPPDAMVRLLRPGAPATRAQTDPVFGIHLFGLQEPLAPGDSTEIDFDVELVERGFKDTGANTRLVTNGTFLTQMDLFPASGYDPHGVGELGDNDQREAYGLPRRPRMPPLDDMAARMHTPLGVHVDWIDFDVVVSTSDDQIAVAPGELVRTWTEAGRRLFHYRAPRQILGCVAILSARYAVRRESARGVGIEIYHHPDHAQNVDLMIESAQHSLDYFAKEFSPYQFSGVRIVEFPRYEISAEAYPGLIPISEGYGFIAKYDEKKVKEVYRVVAHEMGHQWWAHQVIGADVEGFFVLTEVMAQYSALLVSKRAYDRSQMDAYVRGEISRYLKGRGEEVEEEVPLVRTNQDTWYQHYAKGFVVMNALAEYVGEDRINEAIREFLRGAAFQGPPFPTSCELVDHIKSVTPDSLLYLVEDCFERIVLFDNEALSADCERTHDGWYRVTLSFEGRKWTVDGRGAETVAPLRDLIEFAVFGENGEELRRERRWVDAGAHEITMTVGRRPARAGIDPHYLLIDKRPENNVVEVRM